MCVKHYKQYLKGNKFISIYMKQSADYYADSLSANLKNERSHKYWETQLQRLRLTQNDTPNIFSLKN